MSGNGHRLVAREGVPFLVTLLVLAVAAWVSFGPVASMAIVLLLLAPALVLFREPVCVLPSAPLAVLSPAGGRVVSVEKTSDPWLSRPAIRIRVRILPWDPHNLRSPVEGKVMNQWSGTEHGREFDRQYAYWLQTDEGDDLLLALGMGRGAKYTRISLTSGQRAGHGQRCGFLYFSGTIDVYIPDSARAMVTAGDRVRSGSSILAQFVHENGTAPIMVG